MKSLKKQRGTVMNNVPIRIVNMDRETLSSLSKKHKELTDTVQELSQRLSVLERQVERLRKD